MNYILLFGGVGVLGLGLLFQLIAIVTNFWMSFCFRVYTSILCITFGLYSICGYYTLEAIESDCVAFNGTSDNKLEKGPGLGKFNCFTSTQ